MMDQAPDDWRLRERYLRGRCLDLASALARATGLSVAALRPRGEGLAHAFLVLNPEDPVRRWRCLDWIGERLLPQMREDLEPHWGRLRLDRAPEPVAAVAADGRAHESDATLLGHARLRPHLAALLDELGRSATAERDEPGP